MSTPDYPVLGLPSYETYQLAHIATYIAERLARHRQSGPGRGGRIARAQAVRDLAGAATALDNATGAVTPTSSADLPRPLDAATYASARDLLASGPRSADIVSLAGTGGSGWAVIGQVPGIGPVGAAVGTQQLADALRTHFLTQPAAELGTWAVTRQPARPPTLPRQVDLAAFVEHLDPARVEHRAVARHLRGLDRRTDAAVRGRFSGVDLDAPLVPQQPAPAERRVVRRRGLRRSTGQTGVQRPRAAPSTPSTSPGP